MVVVAMGCVVVVVVAVLGLVLAVLWLSWQWSGGGVAVTVFGVASGPVVLNSKLLNVFFFLFFFPDFSFNSEFSKKKKCKTLSFWQ